MGTPVWAGTFAPSIRTFIKENPNIQGKRTAVFTCFSGGGTDKAIEKMKKYIGIEEFEAELMLLTESTGWMIRIIPAEIWIQQRLM